MKEGTLNQKIAGFFKRIRDVVIAPQNMPEYFAKKSYFVFPVIMICLMWIITILPNYGSSADIMVYIRELMLADGTNPFTEEQLIEITKWVQVAVLIIMPLTTIFSWLIGSAVIYGFIKLFKGQGTYKQTLSIVGYSYITLLIGTLVNLAIYRITGNVDLDLSPAVIIKWAKGTRIYGFFRSMDIFTIWQYVVIFFGVLTMSKIGKAKAAAAVFSILAAIGLVGISRFMHI